MISPEGTFSILDPVYPVDSQRQPRGDMLSWAGCGSPKNRPKISFSNVATRCSANFGLQNSLKITHDPMVYNGLHNLCTPGICPRDSWTSAADPCRPLGLKRHRGFPAAASPRCCDSIAKNRFDLLQRQPGM